MSILSLIKDSVTVYFTRNDSCICVEIIPADKKCIVSESYVGRLESMYEIQIVEAIKFMNHLCDEGWECSL